MSSGLVASVRGDWSTGTILPRGRRRARRGWPIWSRRSSPATSTAWATGGSRGDEVIEAADRAGTGSTTAFHRLFFFLPGEIRLLILKDLRTFRRDPAQWSQFLIFFGLLAFYFVNIRRLSYDVESPYWRNLISFLNLSVTAADPLDVHQPVHLPSALARRAELLGPGALALEARVDPLGQVRVLLGDLAGGHRDPGRPQRPDAADEPGHDPAPHGDGGGPLLRAVGDQRRPGGPAAEPEGGRPVQDRRRVRRDAQPPGQPGLHLRDRHGRWLSLAISTSPAQGWPRSRVGSCSLRKPSSGSGCPSAIVSSLVVGIVGTFLSRSGSGSRRSRGWSFDDHLDRRKAPKFLDRPHLDGRATRSLESLARGLRRPQD